MSDETKPIEGEMVQEESREVAVWTPKFIEPMDVMVARRDANLEYMGKVLKEGVHYGVVPGTGRDAKPTLLKPGAQALMRDLGLHPEPVILEHISDVTGADHNGEVFMSYAIRIDLFALRPDGVKMWVGSGVGSCNSWEERYRWRSATRKCPNCGKEAIIKGKAEYGGGWLCWGKKGGCGTKYDNNDTRIVGQAEDKVPNDRVMDLDNTIFKQAAKRATVEAVLNVTGASDVFTQDTEEGTKHDDDPMERARAEASSQARPVTPIHGDADARPLTPMDEESKLAIQAEVKKLGVAISRGDAKAIETQGHWQTWFNAQNGPKSWANLFADDRFTYAAITLLGLKRDAKEAIVPKQEPLPANPATAGTMPPTPPEPKIPPAPTSLWDEGEKELTRRTYEGVQHLAKEGNKRAIEALAKFTAFMETNKLNWTGQRGMTSLWMRPETRDEIWRILEILPVTPEPKGFDPDEVPA